MSTTVARDVTEKVKPPRAVFLPFMMGHLFGVPFHRQLQRRIIQESLEHLVNATDSTRIKDLEITWATARAEGKIIERELGFSSESR